MYQYEEVFYIQQPEDATKLKRRALRLTEDISKRLRAESEDGKKSICYLIISHGRNVDELGNLMMLAGDEMDMTKLTKEDRDGLTHFSN